MKDNVLTITLEQVDATGELSTTTLRYPNLDNAAANAINFFLTKKLTAELERLAKAKAVIMGEEWLDLDEFVTVIPAAPEPVVPQPKPSK